MMQWAIKEAWIKFVLHLWNRLRALKNFFLRKPAISRNFCNFCEGFFFWRSDWQTLVGGGQFWHFISDGAYIGSIGDRWSTQIKKKWDFGVRTPILAPPVATKIILWGTSRYVHFLPPTPRVCQNIAYRLLYSPRKVKILEYFFKIRLYFP